MSTEALNLDQAVERFMGSDEPVQDEVIEETEVDDEATPEEEAEYEETDDDSDVESDDYESEDDDTDEESAEDDDEPEQAEVETHIVKIDGEEVSVTLDDLKRSYSGQGKIQKGMQEAALVRKQAQEYENQLAEVAQQFVQLKQSIDQEGVIPKPIPPSTEMAQTDPIGYMQEEAAYKGRLEAYNNQQAKLRYSEQYLQHQNSQQMQARLAQEAQVLATKIPEFANAKTAAKLKEDLVKTATEFYGYQPDDLSGITDHRALVVLRDAMNWRRSQAKKSQIEQSAKTARPVVKPKAKATSNSQKKVKEAKSKLKRSGSIEDAISLLMNN